MIFCAEVRICIWKNKGMGVYNTPDGYKGVLEVMGKYYVIFNPLSNSGRGFMSATEIETAVTDGEFEYESILSIEDIKKFMRELPEDKTLVLSGGDGTINRFVNTIGDEELPREVYYFPSGSGNDFMRDVRPDGKSGLVLLNTYIKNLPKVTVKGETYRFINGIGYGIDGYCCEVGDKLRQKSDKPVNYAAIAIKGLLFKFKPVTAAVISDGHKKVFDHVWIAPTMNGRYYGGGMKATPGQKRLNEDGTVTTMIFRGRSRLKTLLIFSGISKGEHIKHRKEVIQIKSREVEVKFDRPCALQIDGETVLDVKSYKVHR